MDANIKNFANGKNRWAVFLVQKLKEGKDKKTRRKEIKDYSYFSNHTMF
jgi:hypothetical protein